VGGDYSVSAALGSAVAAAGVRPRKRAAPDLGGTKHRHIAGDQRLPVGERGGALCIVPVQHRSGDIVVQARLFLRSRHRMAPRVILFVCALHDVLGLWYT
jgi:hypothetical protein